MSTVGRLFIPFDLLLVVSPKLVCCSYFLHFTRRAFVHPQRRLKRKRIDDVGRVQLCMCQRETEEDVDLLSYHPRLQVAVAPGGPSTAICKEERRLYDI